MKKGFLDKHDINYKKSFEYLTAFSLVTQIGITMIACILLCFGAFFWIGKYFFHTPLPFAIAGAIIGVAAGLYSNYQVLKKYYEHH